jgi:hypothetical protein
MNERELDEQERHTDRIGDALAVALLVLLLGAILIVGVAVPNFWI